MDITEKARQEIHTFDRPSKATSEQLIAEVERLCGTLKVIAAWAATSASYHRSDSVIEREFTDIEEGIEDAVARIDKLLQPLRAENEELRAALQKVLDDSKIGVVPRSHLDLIERLLRGEGRFEMEQPEQQFCRNCCWHDRVENPALALGKAGTCRVMQYMTHIPEWARGRTEIRHDLDGQDCECHAFGEYKPGV